MKKNFLVIVLISAICFATIKAGYSQQNESFNNDKELFKYIELFSAAIAFIRMNYIREVSPKKLIYGALKGMMSSLDGYSTFLEPKYFKEVKEDSSGKFSGIGMQLGKIDGQYVVISTVENSPAKFAGLVDGDVILLVNDKPVSSMAMQDLVFLIKGEVGTEVTLTVIKADTKEQKQVTMKREIIVVEGIRKAYVIESGIGYIELRRFQEKSDIEIKEKINELEKETGSLSGLILDLRDNAGGLLDQAVAVSNVFLDKGKRIVSTKTRDESKNMEYYAQNSAFFKEKPLILLVNGLSASASEIVAGAIKDNNRGQIVGVKTFGKGSVQTVIGLTDGAALKITTAEYVTPSGEHIDGKGVEPDHVVEQVLEVTDQKPEARNQKPEDVQLDFAVKLLKAS
ncbi:MAG: S41 family peptidase [Candidatus Omnitrophica bacterium]|nr:S41 family peptidase [Candidatus Omnitrophota bacterium]